MQKQIRHSLEFKQKAVESVKVAAKDGKSLSEVARELGVTMQTLWGWVHHPGPDLKNARPAAAPRVTASPNGTRYTPGFKAKAIELFSKYEGNVARVAREIGAGKTSVRKWLDEAGITRGGHGKATRTERTTSATELADQKQLKESTAKPLLVTPFEPTSTPQILPMGGPASTEDGIEAATVSAVVACEVGELTSILQTMSRRKDLMTMLRLSGMRMLAKLDDTAFRRVVTALSQT